LEDLSVPICSLGFASDIEDCADAGDETIPWEADRPEAGCPGKRRRSGFLGSIAPAVGRYRAPAEKVVDVKLPHASKVATRRVCKHQVGKAGKSWQHITLNREAERNIVGHDVTPELTKADR
jgi:hypothetical protein